MIEQFTTCPWLAYATVVERRRPSGESAALRFGGLIHQVLAWRSLQQANGKEINENELVALTNKLFAENPLELEGWRNADSAVKLLRFYNAHYPNEEFKTDTNTTQGQQTPYIEQPFAVDTHRTVRGRRIIYTGRIDKKVRYPDGSTYTLDHKTTLFGGDTFWQDQQMTGQHKGYVWADRECTGEECTGYIVDMLRTTESILNSEFDENLGQLVGGRTATGRVSKAVPVELARQKFFTRVPPGQIDEWFENMLHQVDTFLYHVDTGYFPRHWKHCVGKYGLCQMYQVCSLPKESREGALASSAYTVNEWTPLYV